MDVILTNEGIHKEVTLPMCAAAIHDLLDQLRAETTAVWIEVTNCYELRELESRKMCGNLYAMNRFSQKLESLPSRELSTLCGLVLYYPDASPTELLEMTTVLDTIPVQRCGKPEAMRQIAEAHGCVRQFNEICSRKHEPGVFDKVQKLMREYCGGVIADGYFCKASAYRKPDTPIAVPEFGTYAFRMLVGITGPEEQMSRDTAVWFTLPCDDAELKPLLHCRTPSMMAVYEFESVLPHVSAEAVSRYGADGLNRLAKQLMLLSRAECVKLKAVMQMERIFQDPDVISACISRLDEYNFDSSIHNGVDYAQKFLEQNPVYLSVPEQQLGSFGILVLHTEKHGCMTDYGVVSGRGTMLFAPAEEQEETEIQVMGGMCE